jgi:hypothetical protein
MAQPPRATKAGSRWIFRSALLLKVITAAAIVTLLTDLSLFRATPILYTLILSGIVFGFGLMIRNRYYIPFLRNLLLPGKLLLSPVVLLVLTAPAGVIYIYYDLTGSESLKLLSALFTSFGAAFFLSSLFVVTLPAMASVVHLTGEEGRSDGWLFSCDLVRKSLILSTVLALITAVTAFAAGFTVSGLIFLLPISAIAMMILDIIIGADFRQKLTRLITGPDDKNVNNNDIQPSPENSGGFMDVVLVADHYLSLACGRLDYLNNNAGDDYATEINEIAARTFDPALLPALRAISSCSRFSDKIRDDASIAITVIERYYSDPVRNSDLLRLPGISEKTAVARGIMLGRIKPNEQDIIKLLGDASPEVRRTGLIAAGRFGMTMLRNEVLKALDHHETSRDAFYVLREFGPDVYGDAIGTSIRPGNSERMNHIILRLLDAMPLADALPWLTSFAEGSHPAVRLKAARSLCERGWVPQGRNRQRIEDTLNHTIHTVARIIAMQEEATGSRSYILSSALENERKVNMELISSLLSLLTGKRAAEVILPGEGTDSACHQGIAAEAIAAVVQEPLSRPLRALLGNSTDKERLAELSLYYPIRNVYGRSPVSFLLGSEQNITGTWTKACALHRAAMEVKGIEREQTVSYLFSNSQILQEESARAIKTINPEWFRETESRLHETVKNRVASVINGTLPQTSMLFEKTRFLSLCFNNIPEEKMLLLASGMRYSESYDAGSLPGVISWVVPSKSGKTGLYSLPVSDIAGFVFHYSEYTDIFVKYLNTQGVNMLK